MGEGVRRLRGDFSLLSLYSSMLESSNSEDGAAMGGQVWTDKHMSNWGNTRLFRSMEKLSASKCWDALCVNESSWPPNQ